MATITVDGMHTEAAPKRSFFARALDRVGEAQMQRARSLAKPYMLDMSDEDLRSMGYSREEITRWPTGATRWL